MRNKDRNKLPILGMALLLSMSVSASDLVFKIKNPIPDTPVQLRAYPETDIQKITVDTQGNAVYQLTGERPRYFTAIYGKRSFTLYADPASDLAVSFNGQDKKQPATFEGLLKAENKYLNSAVCAPDYTATALKEEDFLRHSDSIYQANIRRLEAARLPETFNRQEELRLLYLSYTLVPFYPTYHVALTKDTAYQASAALKERIQALAVYDKDRLGIPFYTDCIGSAVMALANGDDRKQTRSNLLSYIEHQVTDSKVAEYLVYRIAYSKLSSSGTANNEDLIAAYRKFVKDPEMLKQLDAVCQKWKNVATSGPSPTFSYKDIDGKTVSLDDLKGKYVYIDVWATWCGPCRAQLPYLKKLEEKYREKDIWFVSISCDQNRQDWEKMVKDERLQGIQLHTGGDRAFMDAYMITGIPRFILLDRDGVIINARMTRPSDPKTAETLDGLLNE